MDSTKCALLQRVAIPLLALALSVYAQVSSAEPLPDLIERLKPSVVVVGTYNKLRSPPFVMRGTGFVVGNGTLIATNAHVLPIGMDTNSEEVLAVQVRPGGKAAQLRMAKQYKLDSSRDLALLQIAGDALPALTLQDDEVVREGQGIGYIGFPIGAALGLSPVTHRGIISAITPIVLPGANAGHLNAKVIRRLKSGSFEVYQLDGTAYPGNSGGPVFEMERGKVIAIINMVFIKGTKESALTQPSGISFAVPVQYLKDLLDE
jgi:S1-C subfamily serine protease